MTASVATNKFGNLIYWTNSDPQSLPTESSTTTTSLKNAFDAVSSSRMIQSFIWANATARNAQTGMVEGDIGDQADTDQSFRYNGSAWLNVTPGIVRAVPSGVSGTGVTLSALGVVISTGGATTSASANGVFASGFTGHIVNFDLTTTAAAGINIALRLTGTDANTAFDSQRMLASSTSVSAAQSLNGSTWVGSGGAGIVNGRQSGSLVLTGAAQATATMGTITNNITANPMTTSSALYQGSLLHRTATAYDGITFSVSSGFITGNFSVEAFN